MWWVSSFLVLCSLSRISIRYSCILGALSQQKHCQPIAWWIYFASIDKSWNTTNSNCERCKSYYIANECVCYYGYLHEIIIRFSVCKIFQKISFDTGMAAGYLLDRYKSAPSVITPFINVVLWMMSLGIMLLLVFGVWNGTLNLFWTALYVSLGHSGEDIVFRQQKILWQATREWVCEKKEY